MSAIGILLMAASFSLLSCSSEPYVFGDAGEDTADLLARYERTMCEHSSKRVVLRVNLADEGLHERGERALMSYRENIEILVSKLRQDGREVSVMLNPMSDTFNTVDSLDVVETNEWLKQKYPIYP